MYKQQGGLPTEETRKYGRHDLNEFTVEDECVPSPAHISRNEEIVLPEIQTMTGYIRRHYEADIIAEAKRKLHAGDLCVRYGGKIYRACPWPGPADYGEGEMEPNDSEFQAATSPINAGDYARFADIRPLNGEITWMNFWRTGGNFVDAELVLTMHIELDIDGVKTDVSERYAVDMWFDMEDDIVGEMGNIQLYYRSAERGGVKLDEYLVPILSIDDIEAEAERILLNINPKGLQDPQLLCSGVLAERLDLQIIHLNLYQKKHTSSILFFGPGELKIKAGFSDDEEPQVVQIPANTIVVNDETNPFGSDPVYHECFHYVEHKLFFQLQRLHNNDVSKLAKWKPVKVEAGQRSPVEWIEWQARYGGRCLQVPRSLLKTRVNEELQTSGGQCHMGYKLQFVGRKLAKEFGVYNYQIRNRMIQTGFWAAKGALNFVDDDYIEPFAFSPGECRGSHTFVISPKEMLDEYVRNEEFRKIIDTGRYIYADGHIVINDPEFVVQRGDKLKLTEWANAHVDKCCLRFVRTYYRDKQTHYVYGQLNSDEEYNGRSLTMSASEKAPHLYEQAMQTSKTLMSLPGTFHETFAKLMDLKDLTVEQLAEETMLSERSITRYRTEERFDYSIDTVAVLCIGMRLDPLLSLDLIRKAGIMLRNTPEDLMINAVLMGMHRFSVLEVAKYLKMSQYPRIKNWPEAE